MNGLAECPPIYIPLGTSWNVLFLNLMNWLLELKGMQITDQDSVMMQYRTDNGWRPLAGDVQLFEVLDQFNNSGWDLYIRCAPESEFKSGSDESEDEVITIKSSRRGSGGLVTANKGEKKVRPTTKAAHKSPIAGVHTASQKLLYH